MRPLSRIVFLLLIVSLLGCNRESPSKILEEARGLFRTGRYEEALARYHRIARDYPDTPLAPRALYMKGVIEGFYLLRFQEAIDTFSKVTLLYPDTEEARESRKRIASIYMDKIRDYSRALSEYEKLRQAYRLSPEEDGKVLYNMALAHTELGDFEKAREILQGLATRYEGDLRKKALFLIGDTYFMEGRAEEAVKTYREIVERYKGDPLASEGRFKMAMALEEMGRYEEALEEYRGLAEDPSLGERVKERIKMLRKRQQRRSP